MPEKQNVPVLSMTSAKPTKPIRVHSHTVRKRLILLTGVTLLLVAALAVRIWHDSRRAPLAVTYNEVEQRAREHPNDAQALLDWGSVLIKAGRRQDAQQVFAHAAQRAPHDARPFTWLGILAVQDHRLDYARVNFLRAVQIAPSDANVWHALGDLFSQAHDRKHAINAYERSVRWNPSDEIAWRQMGVLQTKANLLALGHNALVRAVGLNPDDLEAQIDLGNSALVQGLLPEAQQAFSKVLASKPNDASALLGNAEALMQIDPSPRGLMQAEQQAVQSFALKPTSHAHLILGRIYLMKQSYPRAVDELKAALAADPKILPAYGYLSQAYAGMHWSAKALQTSEAYQKEAARMQQESKLTSALDHGQ